MALPPRVRRVRDELFEDADRHGPRTRDLVRRLVPALALVPLALAATTVEPWRRVLVAQFPPAVADAVLVIPFVAGLVVLAAVLAPVARMRTAPVVAIGGGLLVLAAGLTAQGQVAWASVPASVGALLVGIASARAVRRAVWTLPLLLAAGVSDAHSVAYGVTGRLIDGGGGEAGAVHAVRVAAATVIPSPAVERIDFLVLHVPVLTGTWLLGIVDVVAIGLLLGLAHLFWLPLGRTALALVGALAAALAVDSAVPVLPLLGLAWVLVNARLVWRATRFSLRRLTYLGG